MWHSPMLYMQSMQFAVYDTKHAQFTHAHSYGRKEAFVQLLWKQFFESWSIENSRTIAHQGKTVQMFGNFSGENPLNRFILIPFFSILQ